MDEQLHHDDVIKWKHFPRNWPFVRGIHRSPVNSPHKGQWRRALVFSLICVWINDWVNNREAGDLRCYRAHYDVIVMIPLFYVDVITNPYHNFVCQDQSPEPLHNLIIWARMRLIGEIMGPDTSINTPFSELKESDAPTLTGNLKGFRW